MFNLSTVSSLGILFLQLFEMAVPRYNSFSGSITLKEQKYQKACECEGVNADFTYNTLKQTNCQLKTAIQTNIYNIDKQMNRHKNG